MPLTLESVLKNFEEFAQNQWPTWAKRRGFGGATVAAEFAEPTPKPPPPTPPPPPPPSPTPPTSSSSGRVVQLDKDKWVFQRHRPIAEATTVEPVRFYRVFFTEFFFNGSIRPRSSCSLTSPTTCIKRCIDSVSPSIIGSCHWGRARLSGTDVATLIGRRDVPRDARAPSKKKPTTKRKSKTPTAVSVSNRDRCLIGYRQDAEADADRSAPARTADDDDDVAVVVVEEKTVEILQIDDVRPGQRSRRSSGYASAAGSPVAKRAAETR